MALAILIFVATLALVIWQPRDLGIGFSAILGSLGALAVGVIHLNDIPTVWNIVWNATLTFVAIIIISLLLDAAGFFEWAALHVARWGKGSGVKLFIVIVVLGAAIASVFANDGAALILTPTVMEILTALGFSIEASLAFIMATGFTADSASLPLEVSNLVNIVSADYFHISFASYASVMVPVAAASVISSLIVLYLYYRRHIPRSYNMALLRPPVEAITDLTTFRAGWAVLVVLLVGYFLASPLGIPISAVAGGGAICLFLVAARQDLTSLTSKVLSAANARNRGGGASPASPPRIEATRILKGAPWQIVLFSLGMYLVVFGLRNKGLTADVSHLLIPLSAHGVLLASLGTGTLIAAMSSTMNNMPTVLIGALSIHQAAVHGMAREAMIYANIVGSDLGPKITPIGSLATLLWLHVLRRRGVIISWGRYFRTGIVLTAPVLLVVLATLALRLEL